MLGSGPFLVVLSSVVTSHPVLSHTDGSVVNRETSAPTTGTSPSVAETPTTLGPGAVGTSGTTPTTGGSATGPSNNDYPDPEGASGKETGKVIPIASAGPAIGPSSTTRSLNKTGYWGTPWKAVSNIDPENVTLLFDPLLPAGKEGIVVIAPCFLGKALADGAPHDGTLELGPTEKGGKAKAACPENV